ncbi:hypothetical protein L596_011526 [Steinernema carpocapsae]|uniref:Uncharacterized protein n=1 Tax=Steinernema carpocapsae TaxID=34508 RepID=A0A4U5NUL2_STECR|nr:hypothetical protein L596_011526 [Steinernema carpocapsae]
MFVCVPGFVELEWNTLSVARRASFPSSETSNQPGSREHKTSRIAPNPAALQKPTNDQRRQKRKKSHKTRA